MANYSELLADINAAIYENNDQEIDALEVRAILREMVTSLGSGYLFKGIATPSSPTGTGTYEPDQNVFYLATTAGTYTYLGGLVVAAGEVAFLCFDGTWTKKSSALLSTGSIVDNLTTNDATKPLSAKQGKVLSEAGAATAAEVSALGQEMDEEIPKAVYEKQYKQPIPYELGNITINGSGWTYADSGSRVRTPQGFSLHLFAGDKIALSDYTDARFYWGCLDLFGNYTYGGWLTADYTAEREGYYCILVSNISERSQGGSADALGSLIQITRNTTTRKTLDNIIPRLMKLEQDVVVSDTIGLTPTIVNDLRVDTNAHKIVKLSGEVLYYVPILKGQTITGRWAFPSGYVRFGITPAIPNTGVPLVVYGSGGTGTTSHDFTATDDGYVVASWVGSTGPTSVSFTLHNEGIGKDVKALQDEMSKISVYDGGVNGNGTTQVHLEIPVQPGKYHLSLRDFISGDTRTNYVIFQITIGARLYARYYGGDIVPDNYYFDVLEGEATLHLYFRNASGTFCAVKLANSREQGIFDYNDHDTEIDRLMNAWKIIPSGGTASLVLLHFSDIHADTTRLKRILDYFNTFSKKIDDIIHTGDSVANTVTATSFDFWDDCGAQKVLNCIGNHDVWYTDAFTPPANYPYNTYFKPYIDGGYWGTIVQPQNAEQDGLCYFYKDYANGVRLVVLDYQDAYGPQMTWFADVLADAVTNSKPVIVAVHYPPTFTKGYGNAFDISDIIPVTNTLGTPFLNAVDTFIGNGGEFICWINGHVHRDNTGYYQGTNGKQVILNIDCANMRNDSPSRYRAENSKSQDAFNIIAIKPDVKLLTVFRVGNDIDALQRHIGSMCIKYNTAELISSD